MSLVLAAAGLLVALAGTASFEEHFHDRTLRLDYFHSGTAGEEHVSLDAVRVERAWAGSRKHLLDPTSLGKYRFEVRDPGSGAVLFSRGFSSIYGEWETTGEARGMWRTFHESLRFPEPRAPFRVVLAKRRASGDFEEIWRTEVDPASRFVDRAAPRSDAVVTTLRDNGPPATKVDLLVMGDGYTAAEAGKLVADARRLTDALFAVEPYARMAERFNVRVLHLPAEESGVTDPRAGRFTKSPLGLAYNAFDSERYMLTFENRAVREAAAQAPYDHLLLVANSEKYGGGGILNLYTTVAADSGQAEYIVIHEMGHSFAGLGDEYYTSQVSYEEFNPPGSEPWEPNVTALGDPASLKWKHLVDEGTPIPTPWNQEAYDEVSRALQEKRSALRAAGASEATMDEYFAEVRATTGPMLEAEPHFGEVGAFEGSSYQAKGLYRPAVDCIMFTRTPRGFCPVCSAALEEVIWLYSE